MITANIQLRELGSNPNLRWSGNTTDEESVGLIGLLAAFSSPDSPLPIIVSCIVLDDGEFTFPDNVLGRLSENATPIATSVLHTTFSRRVVNGLGILIMQAHLQ